MREDNPNPISCSESIKNELASLRDRASAVHHLRKENEELHKRLKQVQHVLPYSRPWDPTSREGRTRSVVADFKIPDSLKNLIEETPALRDYLETQSAHYIKLKKAHLKLLEKTRRLQSYLQGRKVHDDKLQAMTRRQELSSVGESCCTDAEEPSIVKHEPSGSTSVLDNDTQSKTTFRMLLPNTSNNSAHAPQGLIEGTKSSGLYPSALAQSNVEGTAVIASHQSSCHESGQKTSLEHSVGREKQAICFGDSTCEYQDPRLVTLGEFLDSKNGYTTNNYVVDGAFGLPALVRDSTDLDAIEVPVSKPIKRRCLEKIPAVGDQPALGTRKLNAIDINGLSSQSSLSQGGSSHVPLLISGKTSMASSAQEVFSGFRIHEFDRKEGQCGEQRVLQLKAKKNKKRRSQVENPQSRSERRAQHNQREHGRRYREFTRKSALGGSQLLANLVEPYEHVSQGILVHQQISSKASDGHAYSNISGSQIKERLTLLPRSPNLEVSLYIPGDPTKQRLLAGHSESVSVYDCHHKQDKVDPTYPWVRGRAKERLNDLLATPAQAHCLLSPSMAHKVAGTGHPKRSKERSYKSQSQNAIFLPVTRSHIPWNETGCDLFKQSFLIPSASSAQNITSNITTLKKRGRLRDMPLEQMSLNDFVINPDINQGLNFAFHEVVRSKDQRKYLGPCFKPECCGDQLGKLVGLGDFPGNSKTYSKEFDPRVTSFAEQHGKHRIAHVRGTSPPGFWRTDMPTTQEEQYDKVLSCKLEQRKIEERYKEAMCGSGRWIFKDEYERPAPERGDAAD